MLLSFLLSFFLSRGGSGSLDGGNFLIAAHTAIIELQAWLCLGHTWHFYSCVLLCVFSRPHKYIRQMGGKLLTGKILLPSVKTKVAQGLDATIPAPG